MIAQPWQTSVSICHGFQFLRCLARKNYPILYAILRPGFQEWHAGSLPDRIIDYPADPETRGEAMSVATADPTQETIATTTPGIPQHHEVEGAYPDTSQSKIDDALATLAEKKASWAHLPITDRRAILRELIKDFTPVAARWAEAVREAEGIPKGTPTAGEEWLAGPYMVVRNLRLLEVALAEMESGGKPRIPGPVRTRPDGQVTARVFPQDLYGPLVLYRHHRRGVDGARSHGGNPDRNPSGGLWRRSERGSRKPGAGGGQCVLHRRHGPALQALRGEPSGNSQDAPLERLPRAVDRRGLPGPNRLGCAAGRLRWSGGGRCLVQAFAGRRDPHHRFRQNRGSHRLRPGRRRAETQGRTAAPEHPPDLQ